MNDRTPPRVPPVGHLSASVQKAPDGSEIRLLVGEAEQATQASLCQVTLGPGAVSRPVRHRNVEEIWYFLEGEGLIWRCPPGVDPTRVKPVSVRSGDAIVIPPGWYFQFRSSPDSTLRFLCHTAPPWPGLEEALPAPYAGLGEPTV